MFQMRDKSLGCSRSFSRVCECGQLKHLMDLEHINGVLDGGTFDWL